MQGQNEVRNCQLKDCQLYTEVAFLNEKVWNPKSLVMYLQPNPHANLKDNQKVFRTSIYLMKVCQSDDKKEPELPNGYDLFLNWKHL